MVEIAKENDIIIDFVEEIGTYIIEGCTICIVYNKNGEMMLVQFFLTFMQD